MTDEERKKKLLKIIKNLVIRAIVILGCIWLLFNVVFSFYRADGGMAPSIKLGDTVMTYGFDRDYPSGTVVAYKSEYGMSEYRVIAVAGDTVDIKNDALYINGYSVSEDYIYGQKTTAWEDGIRFPITVEEGQVFLLHDTRTAGADSRQFGCVDISEIRGKAILVLRRANL